MVFRCPNIQAHYNEAVICINFGTPENNEFSVWNKWKIYYFQVSQYLSTLGYYMIFITGRHYDSDHKRWKANFRCALNSLPDVSEMKDQGIKKGSNAFKVYKFLSEKETKTVKAVFKKRREYNYKGIF